MLIKWKYFNLINITHNVDVLNWHLFIIVIKIEYNSYLFYVHMIFSNENDNIITEFLHTIKTWCGKWKNWQSKYFFIDDFAAKQRAVKLVFKNFIDGKMKINHFFCRTHFEWILNRRLIDDVCKQTKFYLYTAFYFHKTSMECEKFIETVIKTAFNQKIHKYIENKWWQIKKQWMYYVKQHSCFLLQIMTTNIVKFWHHSIKQHAENKKAMMKFNLQKTVIHVFAIAEQWQQRADKAEELWKKTKISECFQFWEFEMFSNFI